MKKLLLILLFPLLTWGQFNAVAFYNYGKQKTSRIKIAFSLRKTIPDYNGNAIRVRRSSDNAETNIGFVSGVLDTATLVSFVGAGTGYVTIWYNQSGNSVNLTQTNTALQPTIIKAGVLNEVNGKVAIECISQGMSTVAVLIEGAFGVTSGFVVSKLSSNRGVVSSLGGTGYYMLFNEGDGTTRFRFNGTTAIITDATPATQRLQSLIRASGNISYYKNNSLIATTAMTGSWGSRIFTIGALSTTGATNIMYQELTYYSADVSDIISTINSEINTYYSIY